MSFDEIFPVSMRDATGPSNGNSFKSQGMKSLVNKLWCPDVIAHWPMSLLFGIWKSDCYSDLWHPAWRQAKFRQNFTNVCPFLVFPGCFEIHVVKLSMFNMLLFFCQFSYCFRSIFVFVEAFVRKPWITCKPCLFIYNEYNYYYCGARKHIFLAPYGLWTHSTK